MKQICILTLIIFALAFSSAFVGCNPDDEPVSLGEVTPDPESGTNHGNRFRVRVGTATFTGKLADNVTAIAFKALLPMTVLMREMNGNEKYYFLSDKLPSADSNPGMIHTGDLMLYGSNCVVIFYEAFQTSYSYTRIGSLDNPQSLASALGSGNVSVQFEIL